MSAESARIQTWSGAGDVNMKRTRGRSFRKGLLQLALQRLAASPSRMFRSYPDGADKVEELGCDWANAFESTLIHDCPTLSPPQREALIAVGKCVDAIGREEWSERSIRRHPSWKKVRQAAKAALVALRMPLALPVGRDGIPEVPGGSPHA